MRSELLSAVLGLLVLGGCSRQAPPGDGVAAAPSRGIAAKPAARVAAATNSEAASPGVEVNAPVPPVVAKLPQTEVTWSYPDTPVGPMSAVVVLPERSPDERFPVLVTFHGTGEARKGPEKGARGWLDDYGMYRALERLKHPPLVAEDFQGFADDARLAKLNAALAEAPYRGLIIVNSYTPDMLRGDEPFSKVPPLADFVVNELLARAARNASDRHAPNHRRRRHQPRWPRRSRDRPAQSRSVRGRERPAARVRYRERGRGRAARAHRSSEEPRVELSLVDERRRLLLGLDQGDEQRDEASRRAQHARGGARTSRLPFQPRSRCV
jgi:hypothetical protein